MSTKKQKRARVEDVRRVGPREARHVGAPTMRAQVAGSRATRLWGVCGSCGARVVYLYEAAPDPERQPTEAMPSSGTASTWLCRQCAGLVYVRQQQRGTRAAYEAWASQNPARAEKLRQAHPATRRFWRWVEAEHARRVAEVGDVPEAGATAMRAMADEMAARAAEAGREVEEAMWRAWRTWERQPKPREHLGQVEVENGAIFERRP